MANRAISCKVANLTFVHTVTLVEIKSVQGLPPPPPTEVVIWALPIRSFGYVPPSSLTNRISLLSTAISRSTPGRALQNFEPLAR